MTHRHPQVVAPGQAISPSIEHIVCGPAIQLSQRLFTLAAPFVCVLATMAVGYLVLSFTGHTVHVSEMLAGAVVNTIGGVLAAGALLKMMKNGAVGIAQAGILGIGLRCGAVLVGMLIAGIPFFGLDRSVLVYWVMGFYFPMLIVESALVAWLSNRVPN